MRTKISETRRVNVAGGRPERSRHISGSPLQVGQASGSASAVDATARFRSGMIQRRTVETGQYVPAGYVMATLLQTDPMLLKFQVLPQDAPR